MQRLNFGRKAWNKWMAEITEIMDRAFVSAGKLASCTDPREPPSRRKLYILKKKFAITVI